MATRRCLRELSRRATAVLSGSQSRSVSSLRRSVPEVSDISLGTLNPTRSIAPDSLWYTLWPRSEVRLFSSTPDDSDDGEGDSSEEEEEWEGEENATEMDLDRVYSPAEKEAEAAEIGYKVLGPLQVSERVFKPYEPVFAVVQIGSHQFKVSNGDSIFVERLKFCDVNEKLLLSKVLLLGSSSQTIIGRPVVPDAAVHAVVEEHALDAKVLIFKKKRRKNYRRTKGHRQELTKLRIVDIQGIEKPEAKIARKPAKAAATEQAKKVEIAA
ncbi:PREDICTED: 50S ribosomal protein L21, mitochondrial [Tarenaya hassleriana]|uniref:50S ribosomal protein L21, mitochondrial n=1 Tax=Tarenaya hassleriana TaxID=28532 RepID=UPI00053CA7C0|nr:PREDICTED: 50S ribosomal protein L21, mitochondrial [Tarenaya hassleriana]XP_010548497.1 PREDICTED: 50S ribosomal protein L21, mitochondrial [Tarenaya hassleriana]